MTRVKPVLGEKALSEQLVAQHIEREMVAEGIVDRTPEGLVYDEDRYEYVVEVRVFRVTKKVRLSE